MPNQPEFQESAQPTWEYDPFADPRTIPHGWDMSEFLNKVEQDARAYNTGSLEGEKDGFNF